uniref:Uncharacterized protein n=1 Tax=Lactuca sativa TaxID=4236 RepID=A0A9R1VHZ4_LACSA|nr:hypothetical protein LSAT_V11C500287790 [Lactuca sativa]
MTCLCYLYLMTGFPLFTVEFDRIRDSVMEYYNCRMLPPETMVGQPHLETNISKDREEVFLKPDPLTPNINLYAPTPLKRTLEIFFRLISANQMSRILKQSRDITIDFHPLFSSISLLSPKSTLLTGDGHSGQREDREEILVIFTAAVILFQQDAKELVHVMIIKLLLLKVKKVAYSQIILSSYWDLEHLISFEGQDNYEYHGLNNASESLKHAMQRAIGIIHLSRLLTGLTAEVDRWFLFASFIPPFVSQFQNLEIRDSVMEYYNCRMLPPETIVGPFKPNLIWKPTSPKELSSHVMGKTEENFFYQIIFIFSPSIVLFLNVLLSSELIQIGSEERLLLITEILFKNLDLDMKDRVRKIEGNPDFCCFISTKYCKSRMLPMVMDKARKSVSLATMSLVLKIRNSEYSGLNNASESLKHAMQLMSDARVLLSALHNVIHILFKVIDLAPNCCLEST